MTKKRKKSYGTSGGVEITDELIEKWAAEAEVGYDVSRLTPRPPGRPPIGNGPASVFQVRLDPELRDALNRRAHEEGTSPSELARRLLRAQLVESTERPRKRS